MIEKNASKKSKWRLTRRKAQLHQLELVIAALLIVVVILALQTLQLVPTSRQIQERTELKEIGWNALSVSDEIGLLRPAVYSKHIQSNSPEIQALEDFMDLILASELEYMLDGENQSTGETWNLIGGEKASELSEEQDIVEVAYLILGNPHSYSTLGTLDSVTVMLSLWYVRGL